MPNLGVIRSGDTVYTMADVPGLIPGASTGKGLGVQFLRHVERCAVLVHVVDMATMEPGRDPESDIEALEHELAEYGGDELDLVGRLRIAVLNKIDVPDARELVDLVRASLEKRGLDVYPVSAATGEGLTEFGYALAAAVEAHRASLPPMEPARVTIAPEGRRRLRLHRRARPGGRRSGFVVRGVRPERWVRQTDFTNDEAVGFLADRLNRLGVEEQLAKAGARRGRRGHDRRGHLRLGADPAGRHAHRRGVRGPRRPRHRQPHRRAAPRARRGAAGRQEGPPGAVRAQRRDLDGRATSRRRRTGRRT